MVTSSMNDLDAFFDAGTAHTSTQMNQLITNSKPVPALAKMVLKRLTPNATKLLFPIYT
jgi:hypothetical protein